MQKRSSRRRRSQRKVRAEEDGAEGMGRREEERTKKKKKSGLDSTAESMPTKALRPNVTYFAHSCSNCGVDFDVTGRS